MRGQPRVDERHVAMPLWRNPLVFSDPLRLVQVDCVLLSSVDLVALVKVDECHVDVLVIESLLARLNRINARLEKVAHVECGPCKASLHVPHKVIDFKLPQMKWDAS